MVTQKGNSTGLAVSEECGIMVFPNPVHNRTIHISVPDTWYQYDVMVTDLSGKIVLSRRFNNSREVVSLGFNPGVYIVNLKRNKFNYAKKVLIE